MFFFIDSFTDSLHNHFCSWRWRARWPKVSTRVHKCLQLTRQGCLLAFYPNISLFLSHESRAPDFRLLLACKKDKKNNRLTCLARFVSLIGSWSPSSRSHKSISRAKNTRKTGKKKSQRRAHSSGNRLKSTVIGDDTNQGSFLLQLLILFCCLQTFPLSFCFVLFWLDLWQSRE